MRPVNAAIIVNANARRFSRAPHLVEALRARVGDRATVDVTDSPASLERVAEAIVARDVDFVIACSGDGGHGAIATALEKAGRTRSVPRLVLAPGGTVGTVARSLGTARRGALVDAIARLLDDATTAIERPSDRARFVDHATLSVQIDDDAPRVAFIVGSGLVARFFALYDARGARSDRAWAPSGGGGLVAAARIVAEVFAQSFVGGPRAREVLAPMPCAVTVDGAALPWPASSLLLASVVRDVGLGLVVTHRAGEDPARPHFVVTGLEPSRLGPRMLRVLAGKPIGDRGEPCFDGLATRMEIDLGALRDRGAVVVDGDLVAARRVSIEAGPSVRLLSSNSLPFIGALWASFGRLAKTCRSTTSSSDS